METHLKLNSDQGQVLNENAKDFSFYRSSHAKQWSGLKKVLFSCLEQVHSPSGKVTFHSNLPNGQGIRQVICQLRTSSNEQTKTCPRQTKFKSYWSRGQAGIQVLCRVLSGVNVLTRVYLAKERSYLLIPHTGRLKTTKKLGNLNYRAH